jgi:UDP-N-acetylglucosamine/UDP-N-acetylgalactosamine diphosphorylase
MTGELDRETILDHVREHDQEHVLRWLDELDAQSTRELLSQLGDVDWDRFDQFRRLVMTAATEATFSNLRPAPIERLPLRPDQVRAEARVIERGEAALRDDRVAALVVAGGQGTRLRYDHPKGMYPISPIRGKSLFQMFAEQILAARREYDCGLPWLIMTSGTITSAWARTRCTSSCRTPTRSWTTTGTSC